MFRPRAVAFHGVLLLFLALFGWAEPPLTRFEVKTLPGWEDQVGHPKALLSSVYTGYIDAGVPPSGKGRMYFHYMMVEAEEKPEAAPVLLWYNGGPGASSLFGIFQEFGPYLLTQESLDDKYLTTGIPTLIENPNRWSKTHTLVAIDSPPPMGLSFCSEYGPTGGPTSCGPWTDKSVFHANHLAHKAFFTDIFPGLKKNPVFFAGESYGGIYVPGFMQEMLDDPVDGLNLRGMLVGDGFPGCPLMEGKPINWCINLTNVGFFKYPNANPGPWFDIEFFHGHQQFSNELYREIMTKCPETMLRSTHGEALSPVCEALIDRMAAEVGPFSAYNLYDNCPKDNPWTPVDPPPPEPVPEADFAGDAHGIFRSLRARRAVTRRLNAAANMTKSEVLERLRVAEETVNALQKQLRATPDKKVRYSGESGTNSPCLANAMPLWFAQNASLAAIGAPPGIRFINLDNGIGFNYTTDQSFVGPIYERIIKSGLSVLMYEGDTDACGLTTSPNEDAFFEVFDASLHKTRPWRPFANGENQDQYLGGYVTEWGRASPVDDDTPHVPQVLFVSIRGAGHMVPLNRPRVAAKMVDIFTHHDIFPDYKPGSGVFV